MEQFVEENHLKDKLECDFIPGLEYALVTRAVTTAKLHEMLVEATGGRVSTRVLSPAGLTAGRGLAAMTLRHEFEEPTRKDAASALARVLTHIHDRIGQTDSHLNSLQLIGARLLATLASEGDSSRIYARNTRPGFVSRHGGGTGEEQ